MIWALLFILLSGSGDSSLQLMLDEASTRLDGIVHEQARMNELESLFESARQATGKFEDARKRLIDEWIKLSKGGTDSDRASYEALFQKLNADSGMYQNEMIAYRMRLRDMLSEDEWHVLFPSAP